MTDKIYDVIIIGGGPAGYSAALYAARAGLDVLVVEGMSVGGQMALTGDIDNYPGFEEGVDGFTLGMRMQSGAERFGAATEYTRVKTVDFSGKVKKLYTDSGELLSKNVIVATGAYPKKLGLDGEEGYEGRGIHYCAHCDGRFYKGRTVAVIGGGNSAAEDALYLSRLADKVYLIHRRDALRAQEIYRKKLFEAENIEFVWDSETVSFEGDGHINAVNVRNVKNGEQRSIPVDGIFVSIGRKPATEFLGDAVALDKNGYIIADETTRTSVPGVYAAGDVRTKALRQVVTAVADGASAVHFVLEEI